MTITKTDGMLTITDNRASVALEAAAEIDQLSLMASQMRIDQDIDLALRGLVMRIKVLSSIIMGALDDENEDTDKLAKRLRG